MDLQWLLFSFSGRINRAKYWLVVLINIIVPNVAGIFAAMAFGMSGFDPSTEASPDLASPGLWIAGLIGVAIFVFSLWTSLAAAVKRLHDREKSGWWVLLFWILPGIVIGGSALASDMIGVVMALVGLAILIWGFVEIACLRGTTGPNAYGPDPIPAAATA
jgi:uncharacterized membrane protein YhaH (DUF805 family)